MLASPNFKINSNNNTVWQRITSLDNYTLDIGMRPTEMFMKFNGVEFMSFDGTTTVLNGISKTYENGLTEATDYVRLGGDLTQTTSIQSDTYTLALANSNGSTQSTRLYFSGGQMRLSGYNTSTYTGETSLLQVYNGTLFLGAGSGNGTSIELTDSAITVTDVSNSKGMVYADDYSGNFTSRSIPDWSAVTTQITTDISTHEGTYHPDRSKHISRTRLQFTDDGTPVNLVSLDAGDVVWSIYIYVDEIFNDGISNQLSIGYSTGTEYIASNTTLLTNLGFRDTGASYIPGGEQFGGTRGPITTARTLTALFDGIGNNATTGDAYIYVEYSKH